MLNILRFQHLASLTMKWSKYFSLYRFPLPDLGEKIKQGKVKKLYVKQGDRVQQFQKIADVESDKQFTEITAPEEGVIKKLLYQEDQTCQVGDIFLEIQTKSEKHHHQQHHKEKAHEPVKQQPIRQISKGKEELLTSPAVNKWAKEHSINLEDVTGTGPKGRILKGDIISYIQNRKTKPAKAKVVKQEKSIPISTQEVVSVKMNQSEQLMQKLATYSNSVPHFFVEEIFDLTELTAMVERAKAKNQKISLLSLMIKTFSMALTANPKINSIYQLKNEFGVSLAQEQNLLLPIYGKNGLTYSILENLQSMTVHNIQSKLDNGVGQTSPEKIREYLSRATTSLSYIGEAGAKAMNPPIFGEMTCHASIGELRDVAVLNNGKIEKRKLAIVTIGADHRVIDGASGTRFKLSWKELSENPSDAFTFMI